MKENFVNDDENNNLNDIFKEKSKTFQIYNFPTEEKNEENYLNETLVDTIMDGEYPISNIDKKDYNSKHKYIYEFFISFFLFINSFISYSFTNIFHLCYSFYIIYTCYTTFYTFRIKLKKHFGIFIIVFFFFFII